MKTVNVKRIDVTKAELFERLGIEISKVKFVWYDSSRSVLEIEVEE